MFDKKNKEKKQEDNVQQDAGMDEQGLTEEVEELLTEENNMQDEYLREIEELKGRLLRRQAEFDNFRRRTKEEAEQLGLFVTAELVKKFLPVADSFERALKNADQTQDIESMKTGMELIHKQIEKSLGDAGVEKIAALGEQFSPDLHEALMNSQNAELPDGQIDMVFEEGYKIKDKVIRHSKVRVVNNS